MHWGRQIIRRLLLGTGLGLVALTASVAVQAASPAMVSVGVSESILRKGPGLNHEGLWSVPRGYPLQIVQRQSGWLQVRDFEGDRTWIRAAATSRTPHFIVKVPTANLRARPSAQSRVLGKLSYGTILQTLAHDNDGWVKVRQQPQGKTGWVAQRLLWGY
ncbi:SH3 domain-containing protein [Comamonadaceae bacterium PP-2]